VLCSNRLIRGHALGGKEKRDCCSFPGSDRSEAQRLGQLSNASIVAGDTTEKNQTTSSIGGGREEGLFKGRASDNLRQALKSLREAGHTEWRVIGGQHHSVEHYADHGHIIGTGCMSSQLQAVFSAFVSSKAGAEDSCRPSGVEEAGPTSRDADHGYRQTTADCTTSH
jgi:hypothetical protein